MPIVKCASNQELHPLGVRGIDACSVPSRCKVGLAWESILPKTRLLEVREKTRNKLNKFRFNRQYRTNIVIHDGIVIIHMNHVYFSSPVL